MSLFFFPLPPPSPPLAEFELGEKGIYEEEMRALRVAEDIVK